MGTTTTLKGRPTRRDEKCDDEIVIDPRSLREKLADLGHKVLGAAKAAWTATKDFILGRPGFQRQRRKAKLFACMQLLAAIVLGFAAGYAWVIIYIVLFLTNPWLGIAWLILTLFLLLGGASIITA